MGSPVSILMFGIAGGFWLAGFVLLKQRRPMGALGMFIAALGAGIIAVATR